MPLPTYVCHSTETLRDMWTGGHFTDLKVTCGDQSWSVHRSILATVSPVFRRMLTSDYKEAQLQVIDIHADPDDVRAMLEFIYCAEPVESVESALPKKLQVSAPGSVRSGVYELADVMTEGYPTWKKSESNVWLVSTTGEDARWQLTDCPKNGTLVGVDLFKKPHGGKMPHCMSSSACEVCKECSCSSSILKCSDKLIKVTLLELATLYQLKDLVLGIVQTFLSRGLVTKDNIVTIARSLRDAGPSNEAQVFIGCLQELASKDSVLFSALLQAV